MIYSSDTGRVILLCASIKAAYIVFIVLCTWMPHYDTSNTLDANGTQLSKLLLWDAVFYARIATHGYEYEQFYAFLPLWPAVLRSCATRGIPLATCAVCINFLCHCIAACILYWLSLQVVSNRHAALATLLFILNPASVFMTVPYTESLFAMLSFAGMLCWKYATQQGRLVWYCAAALCFAMATLLRSNGILHCGFFAHTAIQHALQGAPTRTALQTIACCMMCCVAVIAPLVVFQWQGARAFCTAGPTNTPSSVQSVDVQPAWCPGTVWDWIWPRMYQAVQARYWNVGFLRFYTLQQLPNIALAMSMLTLTTAGVWHAVSSSPRHVLTCGLLPGAGIPREGAWDPVFLWQWAGMALVAVLFMHVHVVTRFLCASCPAVYWSAAWLLLPSYKNTWRGRLLMWWWLSFALVGGVTWCSFLPWV